MSKEMLSENISNEQIRKFSWKRAKECYRKLVVVSLIAYFPNILAILIKIPITDTLLKTIISYILTLIFTPLSVGTTLYFYDVYMNGKSKLNKIFMFFGKKRLLITSFLLGLFYLTLQLIIDSPSNILYFVKNNKTLPNYDTVILVLSILSYILIFIFFYFQIRLYLINYIFARNINKKADIIIKESFHYTKKRVHNIIWFEITVMWWGIIVAAIFSWLFRQFTDIDDLRTDIQVSLLFYYIFIAPYIHIAIAGYAHKIIEDNEFVKKKNKK